MNSPAPTPTDILLQYIENVRQLGRKLVTLRQKQQDNLAALYLLQARCRQVRQNLSA